MKKIVTCPHCGNDSEYSEENPFRPFCSERCQLIDFGKWDGEEFRVPDTENSIPQPQDDSFEEGKNLH